MTQADAQPSGRPEEVRPIQRKILLGFLLTVAVSYAVLLTYHTNVPIKPKGDGGVLEQCRILCLQYGLIPTGHVANDVRAYLEVFKPQDLSDGLADILADKDFVPAATQKHPLLGKSAPDFELFNEKRERVRLSEHLKNGPVVLVFYYGYDCSHCVAQLFVLNDDLLHFRDLKSQVVALSPDAPEDTAAAYEKYGRFHFPVLSDPDNQQATVYGAFIPPADGVDEKRLHGTFVIRPDGTVAWAYTGFTPFTDNKTLLFLLAKERGIELPAPTANPAT